MSGIELVEKYKMFVRGWEGGEGLYEAGLMGLNGSMGVYE